MADTIYRGYDVIGAGSTWSWTDDEGVKHEAVSDEVAFDQIDAYRRAKRQAAEKQTEN